jgi:hypothetical protein
MSHRKTDLGILRPKKSAKVVLRPVEIQDSTFGLFVIQASDGTIRTD